MKWLMIALIVGMTACAATPQQEIVGDIGMRNLMAQYIQRAEVPADRAASVSGRLDALEMAVSTSITSEGFLELIRDTFANEDASPADQLLVKDMMDLARAYLDAPDIQPGEVHAFAKRFIKQARFAASLYE